jgi:RNA polymerase sigma-70 factor (ECF subfamily)
MIPTAANGQPAAAAYLRGADGVYRAYAIVVLTVAADGIVKIVVFGDTALFTVFGMSEEVTGVDQHVAVGDGAIEVQ